ncbi:MAG: hypothetical protein PF961_05795 [Planctomycetota bacterium]|nr:hypothetical protein [Planctomycetota bacterium]
MNDYRFLSSFTVEQVMKDTDIPAQGPAIAGAVDLATAVDMLIEHPVYAVTRGDERIGRVDRSCINSLPFRCWIFGILTAVEMGLKNRHLVGEFWRTHIGAERLEKARALKQERNRRGQDVNTVECLQFGDLARLHLQQDSVRWFDFASKRRAKSTFRQIELLRNNVAHAQDLGDDDWPLLATIAQALPRIVTSD